MIERLLAEHPDWTDEQIASEASKPVYHDIPLSQVAALLVGYKRALLDAAESMPGELARGILALIDATESPHLRVIEASAVPQLHALAAVASQAAPEFAELAAALQQLGVRRGTVTAADVARVRLVQAGRAAYDAAVNRINESYNAWVGKVERGETTKPWSE